MVDCDRLNSTHFTSFNPDPKGGGDRTISIELQQHKVLNDTES